MKRILLIVVLLSPSIPAAAQLPTNEVYAKSNSPTTCAWNTLHLDMIVNLFARGEIDGEYVIVISRLGKKEVPSEHLHGRRLFTVTKYLASRTNQKLKIVTAMGESNSDLGQVEIYLKGKLFQSLIARTCVDIPLSICDDKEFDSKYYVGDRFRTKCK